MKPADFASVTDSGFSFKGELNVEISFRTGFLQAGQQVSSAAESGLLRVNDPPQILQSPSQSSYSYIGMRFSVSGYSSALRGGAVDY